MPMTLGFLIQLLAFLSAVCVYFAFFGKPAQPVPTDSDQTRELPGGIPSSLLFVREDDLSSDCRSALQADSLRVVPQQEQ